MQITINIPDNLPQSVIRQQIKEFEIRLQKLQEYQELKINKQACLEALAKIKQGDKSNLTEIGNVNDYIINLKNDELTLVDIGTHDDVY